MLKHGAEIITPVLRYIFDQILLTYTVPNAWKTSTIILLHKKGNKEIINNYRPISLLSNMYKIFTTFLLNRIKTTLDEQQPREQAGFRKGYSTTDHLHTVNMIIE